MVRTCASSIQSSAQRCRSVCVRPPKIQMGFFAASASKRVRTMEFLHSHEICHGGMYLLFCQTVMEANNQAADFTPSNILHRVSGLDGLAEAAVLRILGEPMQNKVLDEAGESPSNTTAPDYLVYPVQWDKVDSRYITDQACLIDFGESFEASKPPKNLGTPGQYRSPELILDKMAGVGSDLWALGCTLFEIRTGRKLFSPFDDENDDYLESMALVLGKLPEPWWSTTWKGAEEAVPGRYGCARPCCAHGRTCTCGCGKGRPPFRRGWCEIAARNAGSRSLVHVGRKGWPRLSPGHPTRGERAVCGFLGQVAGF